MKRVAVPDKIREGIPCVFAAALTLLGACFSMPVQAHVKWFSRDADCSMPPLSPLQIVTAPEFVQLGLIAMVVMGLAAMIDRRISRNGTGLKNLAEKLDARGYQLAPAIMRFGVAAFYCVAIAYFADHPVFLTPELHAMNHWVPMIQAGIALTLLLRSTAWLGALGMCALYGAAIDVYGWFHLLDYPLFLGIAVFLAIDSLGRGQHTALGLAVLRASAAITLMWGGTEKWLYPWWSYGTLGRELAPLSGGFNSLFFMYAAGWVEFCAAYAMMFGRLGTQMAAAILLVPFIGAVPLFGSLDGIGHAPIILTLVVLVFTATRLPDSLQGVASYAAAAERGVSCLFAGLFAVGMYWLLHAIYYGVGKGDAGQEILATLIILPLCIWWMPRLKWYLRLRSLTTDRIAAVMEE